MVADVVERPPSAALGPTSTMDIRPESDHNPSMAKLNPSQGTGKRSRTYGAPADRQPVRIKSTTAIHRPVNLEMTDMMKRTIVAANRPGTRVPTEMSDEDLLAWMVARYDKA